MQLTVADLKGRIARLEKLARGLANEVGLQRRAEDVLLFRERRQYLRAVQDEAYRLRERCPCAA
jgi:hypothetical protein